MLLKGKIFSSRRIFCQKHNRLMLQADSWHARHKKWSLMKDFAFSLAEVTETIVEAVLDCQR